ncbi:MAG: GNAT family N-acetyltransferase [Caulobacteraceae bacterium]|nr:GNAT family N-acetyltransferase [Caulobacteraceae bacterium]
MTRTITVHLAGANRDLADIVRLFRAYEASIDTDLCFQGFDAEVASLPGKYAPPKGALLMARTPRGQPIGCVAVRPIEGDGVCEMKRLYVAPEGRGAGLGKALMQAAIGEARRIGYREIRLDTLPSMTTAQALYRAAGFVRIAPYYGTPVGGTVFMSLDLTCG